MRPMYGSSMLRHHKSGAAEGTSSEPNSVIKPSLIWPGIEKVSQPHVDRLAQLLDDGKQSTGASWRASGIRGLLAYRTGDADSAVKYIAESEQFKPTDTSE